MSTSAVSQPLSMVAAHHAAECLKTLAHPVRIRLVQQLLQGRYSVGDLAKANDLAPNQCSGHLRLMERCGFLAASREGRSVYYEVCEPALASMMHCIEQRFAGPQPS